MTDAEVPSKRKAVFLRANISCWMAAPANNVEWLYALSAQVRLSLRDCLRVRRNMDRKRDQKFQPINQKTKDLVWQLRTLDQIIVWHIGNVDPSEETLQDLSNYMSSKFPLIIKGSKILRRLNTLFRERKDKERLAEVSGKLAGLIQEAPMKLSASVAPSENFAQREQYIRKAYYFWKRVPKSLFGVIEESLRIDFFRSIISVMCQMVRVWAGHRRVLKCSLPPPWLLLYELRAIGSVLSSGSLIDGMDWIVKQLALCNDLIKESRKSISDFARNRFLIPQFHLGMYEPFELVRSNMDEKLAGENKKIKLFFGSSNRQLESIGVINTQNSAAVLSREFPPASSRRHSLVEPIDSEFVSDRFKKRHVPKDVPQAVSALLGLIKHFRKLLKSSSVGVSKTKSPIPTGQGSSVSFTQFLSSSFGNLDFSEDYSVTNGLTADAIDNLASAMEDKSSKDAFFDKYFFQQPAKPVLSEPITNVPAPQRPVRQPIQSSVAKFVPPVSLVKVPAVFEPPKITNPQTSPLPTSRSTSNANVGIWSGSIEGPALRGGAKEFSFHIGLLPLFRFPRQGTSEYESLEQVLQSVSGGFQFEGSLGVAKFADHYAKLIAPAHRKKREPFSFIVASEEKDIFEKLSPNTAMAFAAFLPPYKLKLWLIRVEQDGGEVSFDKESSILPIVPGYVFGFMEIPLNIFAPSNLVNVLGTGEILHSARRLTSEFPSVLFHSGGDGKEPHALVEDNQEMAVVDLDNIQTSNVSMNPVLSVPPPPHTPHSVQHEALARVFELINQNTSPPNNKRGFQETNSVPEVIAPPRNHPLAPSTASSYGVPSQPNSWSTNFAAQNIVIGAPSSGITVDELPNPKKGACRFYNLPVGCQSGNKCRFAHSCSVCGEYDHPAHMHRS